MNLLKEKIDSLRLECFLARKKNKIKVFDYHFFLPLKDIEIISNNIPLKDFYQKVANGFELEWSVEVGGEIGGRMHFLPMEQVLQDWKTKLYNENDLEQNDLIQFFHPFDLITPEAQCGIMIGTPYIDHEIYFNYSPYPETEGLDLNFEGYLEMAKEARIFYYWPKVLLDIQAQTESPETKAFKQHMPQIFPEFSWAAFVEKYESLRLSKQSS